MDINPGIASSSPIGFTQVNNTLFFAAVDPVHSQELWALDVTVGIKDIQKAVSYSVSPNPFQSIATIHINDKLGSISRTEVVVYDMVGKQISRNPVINNSSIIERDNLQSGIYTFKIISDDIMIGNGKLIAN